MRSTNGFLADPGIVHEVRGALHYRDALVLLGPTGCGKTSCVYRAIKEAAENTPSICHIKLIGSLHADERSGLAACAQQLCHFLHLKFGKAPMADNAEFVHECAEHVVSQHNALLVLHIEQLEHFCNTSSGHTLLYRLTDVATSAGAAIVACARAHDTLERLEKRARSRLGHRHIDVGTLGGKTDITATDANRVANLMREVIAKPSPDELTSCTVYGASADAVKQECSAMEAALSNAILSSWESLERAALLGITASDASYAAMFALCQASDAGLPSARDVQAALSKAVEDESGVHAHLSVVPPLDLATATAAARLHLFRGVESFTFEQMMGEYTCISSTAALGIGPFSRRLCLRSFERHLDNGVFERTAKRQRLLERQEARLAVPSTMLEDAISSNSEAPSLLRNALLHETIA